MPSQFDPAGAGHLSPHQEDNSIAIVQLLCDNICGNGIGPAVYRFWDVVISLYAIDSKIFAFEYIFIYMYDIYFSTIVFKVALKLINKFKDSPNYKIYKKVAYSIFGIYQGLMLSLFVYSVVEIQG